MEKRPEINIPRLMTAYYTEHPDAGEKDQRVAFGTSGHRGTSLKRSFNEDHIAAISQAICEYRAGKGIAGPLFMGMDTHALSEAALRTAAEVFAANGVELRMQEGFTYTPTPVVSHAILTWNAAKRGTTADGVVITPSHNPPSDGGFKYNPPSGGPAGTDVTKWIENRANEILANGLKEVKRVPFERAVKAPNVGFVDYVQGYVAGLGEIIKMEAIAASGLKIGADPLGGSGIDPTFSFMPLDHDGKVRMDCSSPWAMAKLVALKDKYDVAFGNDPDYDRHGIVTKAGLMKPNAYLAVAVEYLFTHRPLWSADAMTGKTLVSSSIIDRAAAGVGRKIYEVPVGFKWFVDGLLSGSLAFGGEESAGASFLRMDGSVWSTDKDGFIMSLLAAEITAVRRNGQEPLGALRRDDGALRLPLLLAQGRARDARREGQIKEALPRRRDRRNARGREDNGEADQRAGQRSADRRPQGDDGERLVRRAPVRHRGHLQNLRGKLQGRGTSRKDKRRGARDSREGDSVARTANYKTGGGPRLPAGFFAPFLRSSTYTSKA